jgi:hypothetical protein
MEKVASGDGTTIAFDRSGAGPPVVVVGGAFSQRKYPDLVHDQATSWAMDRCS